MSMLIGYLDNDSCKRIHINDYDKTLHSGKMFCAYGHPVVGKQGLKKTWHFAHVSAVDSDCARSMGEWHHWWQDRVIEDFLEVVIVKDGKKHIADMINADDIVIEFQKSVIPQETIIAREIFYDHMIWVICCSEQHDFKTVKQRGRYVHLKMNRGSKFFMDTRKPTFLDFDMKGVIEVVKYVKKSKNDIRIFGKIWHQYDFDETFMKGCLKKDIDRRTHRIPYSYEEIQEDIIVTENFLFGKK